MSVYDLMCELADLIPDYGERQEEYDKIMDAIVKKLAWIRGRKPTQEEQDSADGGYILCVSGKADHVTYDHAIIVSEFNWYEDGKWYINGIHYDTVTVHGRMLPPDWEEDV